MDIDDLRGDAIFGGGCFWGLEAAFSLLKGVTNLVSGYATSDTGVLKDFVTRRESGYIEVVLIKYDPSVICYVDLLAVFFAVHDPTSWNRQGNDIGAQYASAIFYTTEAQKIDAEVYTQQLDAHYRKEIIKDARARAEDNVDFRFLIKDAHKKHVVTLIEPLVHFYPAEKNHQQYYVKNYESAYCQVVIRPKIQKVKEKFPNLLKSSESF